MADDVLRVTFEYQDINWLFQPPPITPFSEYFGEDSLRPGIEYLENELGSKSSYKRVEVTILLPADQITPDLETRTLAAACRYCQARYVGLEQDRRYLTTRIRRSLVLAFVTLFVSAAFSATLSASDSFVLRALGDLLGYLAWVAVWFPMDAIVFGLQDFRHDAATYKRLMNMQLTIKPATP
jgi:hypothetical protein